MVLSTKPQLVIFDLDGTLVDSVPDLAIAIDQMLEELGALAAGEGKVRSWIGNGAQMLVKRALLDAQLSADDDVLAQALLRFKDHYRHCSDKKTRLYPGVLPCLQQLAQQQITMAIVTNKPGEFVPSILQSLSIDTFFSLVIGGDDLPEKKPSPQPLLHCMSHFTTDASASLMVGDSVNDIKAAHAANIPIVAVDYGYNHGRPIIDDEPDYVVSSLENLLATIS